jgi:hypothetical protein
MIFGGTLGQLYDFSQMTIIYRKVMNDSDTEKLQIDLDRTEEWAEENAMKINPAKVKQ